MYRITVFLPNTTLTYTVQKYSKNDNRILFIDEKTGMQKNFPSIMCAIEQIGGIENET
jgi:hypothetical protein